MKPKNFATELAKVLAEQGLSQRSLADRAEVSVSGISHLVQGARPEVATLAAVISQACDDPATRHRLVLAHLRDEVLRSGHNAEDFFIESVPEVPVDKKIMAILARHPEFQSLLLSANKIPVFKGALTALAQVADKYAGGDSLST